MVRQRSILFNILKFDTYRTPVLALKLSLSPTQSHIHVATYMHTHKSRRFPIEHHYFGEPVDGANEVDFLLQV